MEQKVLEEFAIKGIGEAIARYTVAIDLSLAVKRPLIGTGSLVKIKGRSFILTCKHLVEENYKNEDLRFFFKSDEELKDSEIREIKKSPLFEIIKLTNKTYPQELSIINRFYSTDQSDDLVLLELEPSSKELKEYSFFEISAESIKIPKINMPIYLFGLSRELVRKVAKNGFGVFPYFLMSKIINKDTTDYTGFDSNKHFLIDYGIDEFYVDPHGLSGSGVWTRLQSGENKLWTPNLRLVGVETGVYEINKPSQPLKATKIERLFKIIENL